MYHVTPTQNAYEILRDGLIPGYGKGLMTNKDHKTYLTNSLKYINIMANDIAKWDKYVVFKVDIDMSECELIWWPGKGFKEWTTTKPIKPENISVYKTVKRRNQNA
jgi:hypothetical protein